jgi:hypothetical protein
MAPTPLQQRCFRDVVVNPSLPGRGNRSLAGAGSHGAVVGAGERRSAEGRVAGMGVGEGHEGAGENDPAGWMHEDAVMVGSYEALLRFFRGHACTSYWR